MDQKRETFLKVASEIGSHYLSSGGATSRLEDGISQAGQKLSLDANAFATPTGIFISTKSKENPLESTVIRRIKDESTNFSKLVYYDRLLNNFAHKRGRLKRLESLIETDRQFGYSNATIFLCHALVGIMGSLLTFGRLESALLSGCVALAVALISYIVGRFVPIKSIFSVFLSSLIGFSLAVTLALIFEVGPAGIAIGTLLILVPGLSLTAAITELAEQNLVSGTVKIGRAILILVAMGVAYLLVQNLGEFWLLPSSQINQSFLSAYPAKHSLWLSALIFMGTVSPFSILMHTPKKLIPITTICGLCSFVILAQFENPETFVLASFVSSFAVGILSLIMSRLTRVPSQIFSTPGILALVPGMLALSSFYSFSEGSETPEIFVRVALTAGAVVFGLLSARTLLHFWPSRTPQA